MLWQHCSDDEPEPYLDVENLWKCGGENMLCHFFKILFCAVLCAILMLEMRFIKSDFSNHHMKISDRVKKAWSGILNTLHCTAYLFVLLVYSEFSMVHLLFEHISYNFFQLLAITKFKIALNEASSMLTNHQKTVLHAAGAFIVVSTASAPWLFLQPLEVTVVFGVTVKPCRYVWLLTTAASDILIMYIVYITCDSTGNPYMRLVGLAKAGTYIVAVPLLAAFWTKVLWIYCVLALPLRVLSMTSALSRGGQAVFRTYIKKRHGEKTREMKATSRSKASSRASTHGCENTPAQHPIPMLNQAGRL